jgi:hypothetical protein
VERAAERRHGESTLESSNGRSIELQLALQRNTAEPISCPHRLATRAAFLTLADRVGIDARLERLECIEAGLCPPAEPLGCAALAAPRPTSVSA